MKPLSVLVAGVVLSVCAAAAAGDREQVYLHTDAVIAGKMMHTFTSAGETVDVILGDFSLTLGKRKISGRNAVLWITERRLGRRELRDIELYVEGGPTRKARIVEADGTTTTDRAIMVVLHQHGRLRAGIARCIEESLESRSLYKRALAIRKRLTTITPPTPTTTTATTTAPARTSPPITVKPAPEPPPRPYRHIAFRADEITSKEITDPNDPKRKLRITIIKGNVYLSQGNPDSDLFVYMRADAAVLYTAPRKDAVGSVPEKIVGAYLEGDVTLRSGERTIQGPRLFYDFRNSRAIIIEPVMRTIQEQRNIPVYVIAKEGRQLGALSERDERVGVKGGKWYFRKAIVTTSDFRTPGYHIAARKVYMEDTTPYHYDEKEKKWVAVGPRSWRTKLENATFNIATVPVLWTPRIVGDAREGHTALRKIQFGSDGRYGWGAEADWYLFRLIGIPRPDGFKGTVETNWYERGFTIGPKVRYKRQNYSGYARGSFMSDSEGEDDFGTERENIDAPKNRGRFLWRHRHFLPKDWQVQMEFSYLCDRNFLEQFHPGEYWTEKPQETLIYAKKQRDNWAFTALGKGRINDFMTQTEAYPDIGAYLIGQPLWGDRLTFHGESHMGVIRYRPDDDSGLHSSDATARGDGRAEIDAPFAIGPVRFLPTVAGRISSWSDTPREGALTRPWGQVGINASTDIWRIHNDVESRLWDLHRIKHVITPYGGAFFSCTPVQPDRLYPFSPEIEQYIQRLGGGTIGVRQLWQTKRGPKENRHISDWLRLNLAVSLFDEDYCHLPSDGQYNFYRPEYSRPRNAVNGEAAWCVSDSTVIGTDFNYDIDSGDLALANLGVTVLRDPRLKYYAGLRYIRDLDSSIGTFGASYQINRKYTVSAFEQYDFDFNSGDNLSTSLTLTRKFPRLYVSFTFAYDATYNDVSVIMSLWPEGIPEARVGGAKVNLLQRSREKD